MGEIAEDIRNGLICQYCGVWMPDVEKQIGKKNIPDDEDLFKNPPQYPRTCPDCMEQKMVTYTDSKNITEYTDNTWTSDNIYDDICTSIMYFPIIQKKPKQAPTKKDKKAFYLGLKTKRQLKNMGMGNVIKGKI